MIGLATLFNHLIITPNQKILTISSSISTFILSLLYSMKIKEQTRKLDTGCSKYSFEVADKTDEVSSKHCFEVVDRTDEVSNHTYDKATLTWFEEIFEEYNIKSGEDSNCPLHF